MQTCQIHDSDHLLGGGKESFEIVNWNKELQLYNVSLLLIKKILKQSDRMLTFVNSKLWIHGCLLYYSCAFLIFKTFHTPPKCYKYLTCVLTTVIPLEDWWVSRGKRWIRVTSEIIFKIQNFMSVLCMRIIILEEGTTLSFTKAFGEDLDMHNTWVVLLAFSTWGQGC